MIKQTGYTLIEIMIALTLGLLVVGSTIVIYIATVKGSSDTLKAARLNYDMEAVMTLMVNDIKRSGYWGGATMATDTRNNPFMTGNTNIQIFDTDADTLADCVLYTYDANDSGKNTPSNLADDVDSNEFYGFKFVNGTIKMRKTGSTTADCTEGTWEEFIDGNQLTITALQFSFAPIATPNLPATSRCLNATQENLPTASGVTDALDCTPTTTGDNLVQKRVLNIVLEGRLSSDVSVTKKLNGTVEIRNNRLLIAP